MTEPDNPKKWVRVEMPFDAWNMLNALVNVIVHSLYNEAHQERRTRMGRLFPAGDTAVLDTLWQALRVDHFPSTQPFNWTNPVRLALYESVDGQEAWQKQAEMPYVPPMAFPGVFEQLFLTDGVELTPGMHYRVCFVVEDAEETIVAQWKQAEGL